MPKRGFAGKNGRLRLRDIAERAGVSVNTVSDILNGGNAGSYRESTRGRVERLAREMGYRPHRAAQIVRTGKSGMLGLITRTGLLHSMHAFSYHAAAAAGLHGYQMLMHDMVLLEDDFHAACTHMLDLGVEGVLLATWASGSGLDDMELFRREGIPLVMVGAPFLDGVPLVYADVRQGMRDLTRHLLGIGYRRLTLVQRARTPARSRNFRSDQRRLGFGDAIRHAGGRLCLGGDAGRSARSRAGADSARAASVTGEVLCVALESENLFAPNAPGRQAMQELLARPELPRAVLCSNDDWALGAMGACAAAGVRVPEDIAVTGFDNAAFGAVVHPALTTVAQPTREMAQAAVDLLLRRIGGARPAEDEMALRLPCKLVVRQSCGAAAVPLTRGMACATGPVDGAAQQSDQVLNKEDRRL